MDAYIVSFLVADNLGEFITPIVAMISGFTIAALVAAMLLYGLYKQSERG